MIKVLIRFGKGLVFFVFLLNLVYCTVTALVVLPEKPTGYVNDYANLISTSTHVLLENTLTAFTASTSNEIAVVTIPSLNGETVEHYASLLFAKWKIGQEKKDNGILLLISREDRTARIEVGYGLEGAVPDILAASILKEKLIPEFKAGKVDEGVTGTVVAIMEATKGEYQGTGNGGGPHVSFDLVMFLGIFGIQGLAFLSSIFARSKSWWAGGVVGAALGAIATFFHVFGLSVAVGLTITFFLTIFGFLFDFLVSNAYNSAKSVGAPIPWWAGGNSGGFRGSSSGGRSFGGFSGGRSGGGGASGSW